MFGLRYCFPSFVRNTWGMARTPDKQEKHTVESISHVANELEQLAAKLRISVRLLSVDNEPPIGSIGVRYETSLVDGLSFLRTWTSEVQERANDARREAAKKSVGNGRVRKPGHVSDKTEK